MPRPIRATISAGALAHHLLVAKAYASGATLRAGVKANAYGQGLERAPAPLDAGPASGIQGQLDRFNALAKGFEAPRSLANSAALIRFPEARGDWVRPGIMLYGCSPFAACTAESLKLKPAMTLGSEIIAIQRLHAGERIGYGFSYEAVGEMAVGVVACGYADGYPRHAPSGTPVLVNGRRTRTVGRVSMDMICVDITGIPGASIGIAVTLWGEGLSADEVAASAGTLSYELLCALAPRVPVAEAA